MMRLIKSGFATGIAMFLTITMHAQACMGSEIASYDPISCTNTTGLDPDTVAFVNLQCGLQAQLFPTSNETTLIFQVAEMIQSPGSYDVVGAGGQTGKIVAEWVQATGTLDIDNADVNAYMSGYQTSAVVGHLVTDDGSAPVLCVSYSYKEVATGIIHSGIAVAQRLTEQQVAERVMELRLAAGPRFVDSATGISYAAGDVKPGIISAAMANASDLSTIYCTFVPGPNGEGTIDETVDCVVEQWKKYQNALQSCRDTLLLGIKIASAALFIGLALCAIVGVVSPPPVNAILAARCAVGLLIAFALTMTGLTGAYEICTRSATNKLKADVQTYCGLTILEM